MWYKVYKFFTILSILKHDKRHFPLQHLLLTLELKITNQSSVLKSENKFNLICLQKQVKCKNVHNFIYS